MELGVNWTEISSYRSKNIYKKRMYRKSEFQMEELLIDDNVAVRRVDNPTIFVGRHQLILIRDVIMIP